MSGRTRVPAAAIGPRRALRAAAAIALTTTIGCAPVQPPGATSAAQPRAAPAVKGAGGSATHTTGSGAGQGVAAGNTVSGGSIVAGGFAPAVVDSGPSADAMAVLATIPEPLSPSERVPPRAAGTRAGATVAAGAGAAAEPSGASAAPGAGAASAAGGAVTSGATAGAAAGGAEGGAAVGAAAGAAAAATIAGARPDSTGRAGADSASATATSDTLVPVPAPTEPLGERHDAFARSLVDTLPAAPPPVAPAKTGPDSCWRIQVAAPPSKQEAELRRQAAESVLLLPFVVEHEKQRYKVRNRNCLGRDAADRLRRRAQQSGFAGAFPVVEVKR